MKKQFVIINKGKGVLKITPSNLNEVEQPLTEIEALYDYVNNQDGEVLLNSKAYTDNQITIIDDAITLLGSSISTVNQNLTTKIEQLDDSVDTRITLLDENVVHKTENETIFGIKTFKDDVIIDNKALKITGDDSQGDSQEVSFGINSEGNIEWSVTDINTDKVTLYFNVNDGLTFNKMANFLGTVKAYPATLSNEVVVKSQLDAVRPYKVYTALLSQTDTNAPIATVLENTLGGTITWVRYLDGRYRADLSYAGFILNKTIGFATPGGISLAASNQTIKVFVGSNASELIVYTIENGVLTDGILRKVPIEIRVYN